MMDWETALFNRYNGDEWDDAEHCYRNIFEEQEEQDD